MDGFKKTLENSIDGENKEPIMDNSGETGNKVEKTVKIPKICSWCNTVMEMVDFPVGSEVRPTHGICKKCSEKEFKKIEEFEEKHKINYKK